MPCFCVLHRRSALWLWTGILGTYVSMQAIRGVLSLHHYTTWSTLMQLALYVVWIVSDATSRAGREARAAHATNPPWHIVLQHVLWLTVQTTTVVVLALFTVVISQDPEAVAAIEARWHKWVVYTLNTVIHVLPIGAALAWININNDAYSRCAGMWLWGNHLYYKALSCPLAYLRIGALGALPMLPGAIYASATDIHSAYGNSVNAVALILGGAALSCIVNAYFMNMLRAAVVDELPSFAEVLTATLQPSEAASMELRMRALFAQRSRAYVLAASDSPEPSVSLSARVAPMSTARVPVVGWAPAGGWSRL